MIPSPYHPRLPRASCAGSAQFRPVMAGYALVIQRFAGPVGGEIHIQLGEVAVRRLAEMLGAVRISVAKSHSAAAPAPLGVP